MHILYDAVYLDSEIPIPLLINAAFSEDLEQSKDEQNLVINAYLTKAKQCKEFFLNEFKELFPLKLQDRIMKISAQDFYPNHSPLEDIPIKWTDTSVIMNTANSLSVNNQLEDQVGTMSQIELNPNATSENPYFAPSRDDNNEMLIDIPPELAMEWFGNGTTASTLEVLPPETNTSHQNPIIIEDAGKEKEEITALDST